MFSDSLSIVIAGAAFALALISPVVSAWISSHYNLKLQKYQFQHDLEVRNAEFYTRHRAEVIERFVNSAGAVIEWNDASTIKEFGKASGEIYLYVSPALWPDIDELREAIEHSGENARHLYMDVCKSLRRESVRNPDKQK